MDDKNKFAVDAYNEVAQIYTHKYFDDDTDYPYIRKLLDLLPKGGSVLDVGSGPGNNARYIKEQGFTVQGIDLSEEMVKIAREKVPGTEFKIMDMRKLDFPENTFNGILSAYSLIHIPNLEVVETLKGFHHVLKPDGAVLVIAQKGDEDKIEREPLKEGLNTFINFYTKEKLFSHLTNAHFKVISQDEKSLRDPASLSDTVIYTLAKKTGAS